MTDPFNPNQGQGQTPGYTAPAGQPAIPPLPPMPQGAAPLNVPGMAPAAAFGSINLAGVEASNQVAPGQYYAYLDKIEQGSTKNGDPKLVWHFRIFGHEQYNNRVMQLHTALSPQALFRVKQVQEALGKTGDQFQPSNDMLGTIVVLKCTESVYEGKARTNIDGVFPAPAEAGGPGAKRQRQPGM